MEEPVDVYSRHGGRNKSCSKPCDADMSGGIHKDIGLEKRERVANARDGGMYNLNVSVDDVQFVHLFHTACYSQQLSARR